jgi:hypothetical protein
MDPNPGVLNNGQKWIAPLQCRCFSPFRELLSLAAHFTGLQWFAFRAAGKRRH